MVMLMMTAVVMPMVVVVIRSNSINFSGGGSIFYVDPWLVDQKSHSSFTYY